MSEKANGAKTQGVYKFTASYARMGTMSGVFVATREDVDSIIGKRIAFGDALGKHSDVRIDIERSHIKLLTEDADFIEKFSEFKLTTGYNPLTYYEEFED